MPSVFGLSRRLMHGSLLLRFSLLSMAVLVFIAATLGWVLQGQMEHDALVQQADEVTAIVDGVVGRHLSSHSLEVASQPAQRAWWTSLANRLLQADRHIKRIKVWDMRGRVVYSNNPGQIGRTFPIDDLLLQALHGSRSMEVSNLSHSENAGEHLGNTTLLESYIPIRTGTRVIGAYEAYSDLTAVESQLTEARRTIWASVVVGFLLLFASLFAIVRSASRRLVRQMKAITNLEVQAREAETLRQVDQLKDEFISTVSHELRRPLASIKGYTESLLLPEAHWDTDVRREFLQVIDAEADTLSLLIDNLLDLSRLGSGTLQLAHEPIHLPSLTAQVVQRIEKLPHLPPHAYHITFPERFPTVEGDPARMVQVLLNLLENAAKYSTRNTPIEVEGRIEGGSVAVCVHDQGPGLTPEQARHVFDKFYRVDSGLTRATEGTGLGLAICRGVVEAHGGTITVDTTPGKGATFVFRLPVAASSATSSTSVA